MRKHAPLALVLLCAIVAVAAYLQALDYPFVDDDDIYIVKNTKLAGLHLSELWRLFSEPYNDYEFLPLRDLSYWLDIALFGLTPAAFRLHSILLYLLCLPLVYYTSLGLWRYFRPADISGAPWAAAAVTALFAVHPSHVDAVVWISSRKDVLSTLFSLLGIWFALHAKRENGFSNSFAVAALAALLAAMLSKATTVAVAPVIAMLWLFFWRDIPDQSRHRSVLLWPFASLLLAACFVLIFSEYSAAKAPVYFGFEVITRVMASLGWLARLSISPESRHFIYPVFDDPYLPVMVAFGVVILVAALASLVMILRKRSLEGFALIAFVLLCMPYSQLIPYYTNSLVADRFLTLATWPAMVLIVSLSWRLKKATRAVLLLITALLWVFQTVDRPNDWRSHEALVDTDLQAYPGHYLPAYQKIIYFDLPKQRFREAGEIANSITLPEARDIMTNLVEVSKDLRDVSTTGDPHDAMIHLQNLERLFKKPPPLQAKWNPTMLYFWQESQDSYVIAWRWLVKIFPDDEVVRYSARVSLQNVLKYGNAVTRLQSIP
jgi:hypothetical protein